MNLGYRYHYGSSAGYQYRGISGTLGQDESGQVEVGNFVGSKFFGPEIFLTPDFFPQKFSDSNFFGPTSATFGIWQSC